MQAPEYYMQRALALAEHGLYTTTPNPRVGCVIVDQHGEIIGEGWTQPVGRNHAEVQAILDVIARDHSTQGATAYVTLEPCSHYGRTPPCCDLLINAGITRIVAAMQDPNPLVAGKGFEKLGAAGVAVSVGLLEEEASALNAGFISRITRGRPFVRLKVAASLDGRTAMANGESQWITSDAARADGHHWRARSCAVLTGIGTILADDPQLNVRALQTPRQPVKVIVDSQLRTPPTAAILCEGQTLIATCVSDAARHAALQVAGAEILVLPATDSHVDLNALMEALGQRGFNEVLCEAGSQLNGALIAAGCIDELLLYLAPKLLGSDARAMLNLPGLEHLADASGWVFEDVSKIGNDLRVLARRA